MNSIKDPQGIIEATDHGFRVCGVPVEFRYSYDENRALTGCYAFALIHDNVVAGFSRVHSEHDLGGGVKHLGRTTAAARLNIRMRVEGPRKGTITFSRQEAHVFTIEEDLNIHEEAFWEDVIPQLRLEELYERLVKRS